MVSGAFPSGEDDDLIVLPILFIVLQGGRIEQLKEEAIKDRSKRFKGSFSYNKGRNSSVATSSSVGLRCFDVLRPILYSYIGM